MRQRWIDVSEQDWYYNEVMEASNYLMEDGSPFVAGIAYGVFKPDAPYVYREFKGGGGQKEFTVPLGIKPTTANPLYVYIDGVQTIYKEIKHDDPINPTRTTIVLFSPPPNESLVAIVSKGIPEVYADTGKPMDAANTSLFRYPHHTLDNGSFYYFNPFTNKYQEYLYAYGRTLKRIDIPYERWVACTTEEERQCLVKKYIGYQQDVYTVCPPLRLSGQTLDDEPDQKAIIYLPYNLNGVTCRFVYNNYQNGAYTMKGGPMNDEEEKVWYNDRFFPDAACTRAEAITWLDRLRRSFFERFTDIDPPYQQVQGMDDPDDPCRVVTHAASVITQQELTVYAGQRAVKLNFTYPRGEFALEVTLNGNVQASGFDFEEHDEQSLLWNTPLAEGDRLKITYVKRRSKRFEDVGYTRYVWDPERTGTDKRVKINGTTDYWVAPVLAMEDLLLIDDDPADDDEPYLVKGYKIQDFHYYNNEPCPVIQANNAPSGSVSGPHEEFWFMPHAPLTRAEAVTFLNRFRKWCIERLKSARI